MPMLVSKYLIKSAAICSCVYFGFMTGKNDSNNSQRDFDSVYEIVSKHCFRHHSDGFCNTRAHLIKTLGDAKKLSSGTDSIDLISLIASRAFGEIGIPASKVYPLSTQRRLRLRPAISLERMENGVYVRDIPKESLLARSGLSVGDKIIWVEEKTKDGQSDFLDKRIPRSISDFEGFHRSEFTLSVRKKWGNTQKMRYRLKYSDFNEKGLETYGPNTQESILKWMIPKAVAVIQISSLEDSRYNKKLVTHLFKRCASAKLVILDLRNNSKGLKRNSYHLGQLIFPKGTIQLPYVHNSDFEKYLDQQSNESFNVKDIYRGVYSAKINESFEGRFKHYALSSSSDYLLVSDNPICKGKIVCLINGFTKGPAEALAHKMKQVGIPICGTESGGETHYYNTFHTNYFTMKVPVQGPIDSSGKVLSETTVDPDFRLSRNSSGKKRDLWIDRVIKKYYSI